MKKLIAVLAIAILLAVPTFAKEVNIHACTADSKAAVLTVDINDSAEPVVVAGIAKAFIITARALKVDVLLSGEGFRMFIQSLTQDEYDAVNGIQGPPVIGASCKVA